MNIRLEDIERLVEHKPEIDFDENICMLSGQFSSGKSKFINCLMGFECLPVGTLETTVAPTFVTKGEDATVTITGNEKRQYALEDAYSIKKGNSLADYIYISSQRGEIPDGITFVDMPGVNSVNDEHDEQFEKMLKRASVVFYFLGKGISLTDLKYLDVITASPVKPVIIRTRLDRINISEESIEAVINEENSLIKEIYPNADVYFISLTDDCAGNQLSELKRFISYDLKDTVMRLNEERKKAYVENTLKGDLLAMRDELSATGLDADSGEKIEREINKTAKKIRRNLENAESEIIRGIEVARDNYLKLVRLYIENKDSSDVITKVELQHFIKSLLDDLECWYKLEVEDILKRVDVVPEKINKGLVDSADIDRIISGMNKSKRFFFSKYSLLEDEATRYIFRDKDEAKRSGNKIMQSIFTKIFVEFNGNYKQFIDDVVSKHSQRLNTEFNSVKPLLGSEKNRMLAMINDYLGEIDGYVYGK